MKQGWVIDPPYAGFRGKAMMALGDPFRALRDTGYGEDNASLHHQDFLEGTTHSALGQIGLGKHSAVSGQPQALAQMGLGNAVCPRCKCVTGLDRA